MDGSWSNVFCLAMGAVTALVSAFFGAILARSLEPKAIIDKITHPLRTMGAPRTVENVPPMSGDDDL